MPKQKPKPNQQGRSSSNMKLSPVGQDASTRFSLTKNVASANSATFVECGRASSIKQTISGEDCTLPTVPVKIIDIPSCVKTVNLSTVLEFFHLSNLSNATKDEAIFLHLLYAQLGTQAQLLSAVLPYSTRRVLGELFKVMENPLRDQS